MRPPLTVLLTRLTAISFSIRPSFSRSRMSRSFAMNGSSELQAGFTRGIGKGLDAAMKTETGTVEGDGLDALGERGLGHGAAHGGGGFLVLGATVQALAQRLLDGGGGRDHGPAVGGEDLGVDMLAGAVHAQARNAQLPDMHARALRAAQS